MNSEAIERAKRRTSNPEPVRNLNQKNIVRHDSGQMFEIVLRPEGAQRLVIGTVLRPDQVNG
ncbi:MAG: hypothetical protein IPN08_05410 [Bacteroidales bacterium]|nr:hypothetical protein [Bacteroidales bacterium]